MMTNETNNSDNDSQPFDLSISEVRRRRYGSKLTTEECLKVNKEINEKIEENQDQLNYIKCKYATDLYSYYGSPAVTLSNRSIYFWAKEAKIIEF